jgi:AmiR/NasT family two-component response regulator
MASTDARRLSTLVVNERADRLAQVGPALVALGHDVVSRRLNPEDVPTLFAAACPDLAMVALGEGSDQVLGVIEAIVREAVCPVILLLHDSDPELVHEASMRGIFAHTNGVAIEDWPGSIEIVLCRFAEYQGLWAAFRRRTVIERAKGILMERHGLDDADAFELLRDASRTHNRKLVDLAAAVADGHRLLPKQPAGRFVRDGTEDRA